MRREAIVEAAEAYLRQWNGCTATVRDIARFRTAEGAWQAVVTIEDGDGRWALHLDTNLAVLADSLSAAPADITAFIRGLVEGSL